MTAAALKVVVIGGGFAGLWCTRALARAPVEITLIDRANHHLFQPLLYQVATAGLSAGDIAAPLRQILRGQRNASVRMGEVNGIDLSGREVALVDGTRVGYDFLLVASGATHAYFGHDEWAPHAPGLRVLGTVPTRFDLQPEEEDGLTDADADRGQGETLAWVRYPSAANLVDCQPWWDDTGVRLRWTADPAVLAEARAIVLPGTKNTIGDMRWLRETGLDRVICEAARRGTTVIGVCGGYQMLGEWLRDPTGVAGDAGEERGLGLLPLETVFRAPKIVCQTVVEHAGKRWTGYELHMGRTTQLAPCEPLNIVWVDGVAKPEGVRRGNVMATYLHGWFDLPELRAWVATQAGFRDHRAHRVPWPEKRQAVYRQMGEHIAQHLNLDPVRRYLQL